MMRAIIFLFVLHAACGQSNYGWNGQNQPAGPPAPIPAATAAPVTDCNSDLSSCGCCLMQREMTRMEQFFNFTVDEINQQLTNAKTSLNNIRASRSVFSVALNNVSALTCIGPNTNDATIVYKTVFYNTGGYNTQTGVFTVPRSGVYSLAVTTYSLTSADKSLLSCANLIVNGVAVSFLSERNGVDNEDSSTVVVAISLKAGDQVSVSLLGGCNVCDNTNHFNTFTGFLLYAV